MVVHRGGCVEPRIEKKLMQRRKISILLQLFFLALLSSYSVYKAVDTGVLRSRRGPPIEYRADPHRFDVELVMSAFLAAIIVAALLRQIFWDDETR